MVFYEVPSEERELRLAKKETEINRSLIRFSPNNSQQDGEVGFGSSGNSMGGVGGVNIGNFVMNPEKHYECVKLSWSGGSGTLKIGDTVTTSSFGNNWYGTLIHVIGDEDAIDDISNAGTGIFQPNWLVAPVFYPFVGGTGRSEFTDEASVVLSNTNFGGDWTGDFTQGTKVSGQWVIQSASMVCEKMEGQILGVGGSDPTMTHLYDAKAHGQFITIKPITGRTLNVNTGGNLNITANTTVSDTDISIAQWFANNVGDVNVSAPQTGVWNFASTGSGSGGGSGSGLLLEPVRVASNGNNPLHPVWGNTIDGWVLIDGDRFLIKDQDTPADNGIYVWHAGASTRAEDFDTDAEVLGGTMVYNKGGNTQADNLYSLYSEDPIIVGTDPQTWKPVNQTWAEDQSAQGNNLTNIGYVGTNATDIASLGNFRLAFDEYMAWRDVTNMWDATYRFNASNEWEWETNGVPVLTIQQGTTDFEQQNITRTGDINAYTGDHDIGNTDPYDTIIGRKFQPSHMVYTTGSVGELRRNATDSSIYIDMDDAIPSYFDIRENGRGITGSLTDGSDPFVRFEIASNRPVITLYNDEVSTHDPMIKWGAGSVRGEIKMWNDGNDFSIGMQGASTVNGIIFDVPFTNFAIFNDRTQSYIRHEMNYNDLENASSVSFADPSTQTLRGELSGAVFGVDGFNGLRLNAVTGNDIKLSANNVDTLTINTAFAKFEEPILLEDNAIFFNTGLSQSIIALAGANNHSVGVGGAHDFYVNGGLPRFGITEFSINTNEVLEMHEHSIFWDLDGVSNTFGMVGGASAGGFDFDIPDVVNYGYDFHIGAGLPVMGITKNEIGLNVPLDMNLSYIKFQGIGIPPAPTLLEKRFLFSDSTNGDSLSIRTPSGVIDLEASGGLTTNLSNMSAPTIPPVDLNMNGNDIIGIANIDLDGSTATVEGVANLNFFHSGNQISSLTDLYYFTSFNHIFAVLGATKMTVASTGLRMNSDINMLNFDITGIDDMTFTGSLSVLNMNNGDITNADLLDMNGSGSQITDVDFLTFFDGGGILNMNQSDITNVDNMTFNGASSTITNIDDMTFYSTTSVLDMANGNMTNVDNIFAFEVNVTNLDHANGTIGFFGQSLQSRKTVNATGGAIDGALIITALGSNSGYGLVISNV